MKNTLIPLSIAFLDSDGSVIGIQDMEPNNAKKRFWSPAPIHFALEVNQGWFKSAGVEIGDKVEIKLPEDIAAMVNLDPNSKTK